MNYQWEIIHQEKVQAEKTIPIPPEVHSVVGFDHELHGPCIHWNYEQNANYIVLSQYPLRDSNYIDVDRTKIYDIEGSSQERGRIRIPDNLNEIVKSNFIEGNRVNYMAYGQMIEQENPTIFLLSNNQFQEFLPSTVQQPTIDSESEDEIQQSMMNLPSFLPSP